MAIRYYDEAVIDKLKRWIRDPKMNILGPNETSRLFQMRADQTDDKPISLPLIAVSRDSTVQIISTAKRPLTYDAGHLAANTKTSSVLNAIPIKITYQLDIYTKYFAEADEYARNFAFNIINYPNLRIEIPYNNAMVEHDSTLILESTIADNSAISERLISGEFYRLTLRFTIDDAYLFSVPFMDNWNLDAADIEIYEEKEKI